MTEPLRLLIVEDSEDDALLIVRALQRIGYTLTFERVDKAEPLQFALAREPWDLVISDYAMPGFNGLDALRIVRESQLDLPFIIVSGTIGEEIAVQAMKSGAHDYVMKGNLTRLGPAVERELQDAQVRLAHRKADEELRKLSRAIEQNPAAVIITDVDGIIEYVNPKFSQFSGYEAEEVLGKNVNILRPDKTPSTQHEQLWFIIMSGREWSGEFQNRKKTGEIYWVTASISPIFDQENVLTHFVAIEEDITARRQNEAERTFLLERMRRQQATIARLSMYPALAEGHCEEAFEVIARNAAETLAVSMVSLWSLSAENQELVCLEAFGYSPAHLKRREDVQIRRYPRYFAALYAGQAIDAEDVRTDSRTSELVEDYWALHNIGASLQAPIRLHGQVIGVVRHEHVGEPRAWHPDEITFAGQIADLAAQTLLNADLRRRADELATITRVSREIASMFDLQQVFDSIARHAAELSHSHASTVFSFRPNGRLYAAAGYGVEKAFMEALNGLPTTTEPAPLVRALLEHRPFQIADLAESPECLPPYVADFERIQALLVVPILKQEELLGGLVLWHREPRHFTPQEVAFIQALAQQCVNAVVNAHLLDAEARRRREAETLQAAMQALSATLNLQEVLELILSELQKVIPYDSASVQQLSENHLTMIGGHGFPNLEALLGTAFDLLASDNPNREVIAARAPLILEDAPALYKNFHREPHAQARIRSWLGVPLFFGDRLIGMIALDKHEPGFYTQEHARLALAFAAQAAIAIENARIFAEEEQRTVELARALEKQRELDSLKNQFIQNVSHELRTPLAIARGYAELLDNGSLGELLPAQRDPVAIIARRMQMLTDLVSDINAILEVETHAPVRQPVDFSELTMGALKDFKVATAQVGLLLYEEVVPALPKIRGDATYLRRVLDNLLGNALKFTPKGGSITVCLKQEDKALVLEVTDTGIGIPADKLERIFERFYQVDGSMSRRYGGSGLGLSLVKEIVEAHAGSVEVESELGKGSTFRVRLPLTPAEP